MLESSYSYGVNTRSRDHHRAHALWPLALRALQSFHVHKLILSSLYRINHLLSNLLCSCRLIQPVHLLPCQQNIASFLLEFLKINRNIVEKTNFKNPDLTPPTKRYVTHPD